MGQIIGFFESFGIWGLFLISFIESFISPILPDVMLIPMMLSMPDKAVYYSAVVTTASVLGGFIGYGIGARFGQLALNRFVPEQYTAKIKYWFDRYGGWAIFLAAMAPIPYKFVCISAGTFRTNIFVFTIASVVGRSKRFLLLGILFHYYGPAALKMLNMIPEQWVLLGLLAMTMILGAFYYRKYSRRRKCRQ